MEIRNSLGLFHVSENWAEIGIFMRIYGDLKKTLKRRFFELRKNIMLNSIGSFSLLRCPNEMIPTREFRSWSLLYSLKIWEQSELRIKSYNVFAKGSQCWRTKQRERVDSQPEIPLLSCLFSWSFSTQWMQLEGTSSTKENGDHVVETKSFA